MLRYEFIKCIDLRNKLAERIKGKIFVSLDNGRMTISIFGCPTCRYTLEITDIISLGDINEIADSVYYKYRQFIDQKFFIGGN